MILTARALRKEYSRGGRPFLALDDVSLSLAAGEFVCLTGRSGSGKSTLLNILAGLLTPDAGSVSFAGREYGAMDDKDLSRLRNTRLGYIMQGHSLLPNFTVLQNVILPRVLFRRADDPTARALDLLEQMGIRQLAAQYPASLSGGELRRAAITRALLPAPELLLADEPTGDLDEETAADIMRIFAAVTEKGTAVLMATHDAEAVSCGRRLLTMRSGRLV
ncbi:MAG: ABC transporter ATP-binding protein [Gracilibacteraceae bacterium]|nr:ABC transporter ATP-binding protein [Gracilibacteraceae bacterium]